MGWLVGLLVCWLAGWLVGGLVGLVNIVLVLIVQFTTVIGLFSEHAFLADWVIVC